MHFAAGPVVPDGDSHFWKRWKGTGGISMLKWLIASVVLLAVLVGGTLFAVYALSPQTWYGWTGGLDPTAEDLVEREKMRAAGEQASLRYNQQFVTAEPSRPWTPLPGAAWFKKNTVDAYSAAGSPDPTGNGRRAVSAFGRMLADDPSCNGDELNTILASGISYRLAGGNDVLVRCANSTDAPGLGQLNLGLLAIPSLGQNADPAQEAQQIRQCAYSSYWKVFALLDLARRTAGSPDTAGSQRKQLGEKLVDEAISLLPSVARETDLPTIMICRLVDVLGQASIALRNDRDAMTGRGLAVLEKAAIPRTALLTAMGSHFIRHAWDARGGGYADTVSDEAWKLFHQRTALARSSLEEAYRLDPSNTKAATLMITVEMADGAGGRSGMERWYGRALQADPNCYEAASNKMLYLEPKWSGSPQDMVQFGRQLADEDHRKSRFSLQLPSAHWTLSRYSAKDATDPHGAAYFKTDPRIWDDINSVYEPYLKRAPESRFHRTRYAVMAAWCGKWDIANQQFETLGPQPSQMAVEDIDFRAAREEAESHGSK